MPLWRRSNWLLTWVKIFYWVSFDPRSLIRFNRKFAIVNKITWYVSIIFQLNLCPGWNSLLGSLNFFFVLNVSHKNVFWILFIYKDIAFYEFQALIIGTNVHTEKRWEKIKQVILIDVWIELGCHWSYHQNRSEKIYENFVQDRILTQNFIYCHRTWVHYFEEINQ